MYYCIIGSRGRIYPTRVLRSQCSSKNYYTGRAW